MVSVMLLGDLGKRFGRRFKLDIKTPAEAIRALVANFPEFEPYLVGSKARYKVIVGKETARKDELHTPCGTRQVIKIVPVLSGAGGFWSFIAGAALIVASFFIPPVTLVSAGALGAGSAAVTLASIAFSVGVSVMLGGVAQMLSPTPKTTNNGTEQNPSYTFNGAANTTTQGSPIAIGYGRMRVGSVVISAGLASEQIAA